VLAASCHPHPDAGDKVKTQTDRAKTRAAWWSSSDGDQPAAAATHDLGSDWAMAARTHVGTRRFPRAARPRLTRTPFRPWRSISMHAFTATCCVRACARVSFNDVIGMAGRGIKKRRVFDFDDPAATDLRRLRRVRAGMPTAY